MEEPEYWVFGKRPVKYEPIPEGGAKVLKLNWETLAFEYGNEYLPRILFDHGGDVENLSREQFIQHVESLRARSYTKKDDVLGVLYQVLNAFEDVAKEQGRALSPKEKTLVAEIRRRTYELFQEKYPDP
jgi:hypothetical protein